MRDKRVLPVAPSNRRRYVRSVARPLRIQLAGGTYHVTARGNRRQPIFLDSDDHYFHTWCLRQTTERFGFAVLAWVHMTNHFHMLVRTAEANLSQGMHWLNGLYAQFFNDRHGFTGTGHLFQDRFHSVLIEDESHLIAASRYDDFNPVRAGLCEHPLAWRWSSCRAMCGLSVSQFVDVGWLLRQLANDREQAHARYLELIEARMLELA
jgi:REP element-mobilizing transposase RayT